MLQQHVEDRDDHDFGSHLHCASASSPKGGGGGGKVKAAGGKDELEAERVEGEGEQLRQAKKANRQYLERREEVGAKEANAEAGALVVEYLLSRRWW